MLTFYSDREGTPVTLVRLNYANALRYGVLVDIAQRVLAGDPVDVTMGAVNVIWQGDANSAILQSFSLCSSPPAILNVAGPEVLSVRWLAERFAEHFGVAVPGSSARRRTTALLSDASRWSSAVVRPSLPVEQLIEWTAAWVGSGGALLGKPTDFQVRDGRF